jgi:hypothetical protein
MPNVDVRLTTFKFVYGLEYAPATNPKFFPVVVELIVNDPAVAVVVIRFVLALYVNVILNVLK